MSNIIYKVGVNDSIPVVACNLDGTFHSRYESMGICARRLEMSVSKVADAAQKITLRAGKYLIFPASIYKSDQTITYKGLMEKRKFFTNRLSEKKITRHAKH